jgi:hypothetical protein
MIEDLAQGPRGSDARVKFMVKLSEPPLCPLQGILGIAQAASRAIHRPAAVADRLGLFGQACGQEFLFCLGEFMTAEADLLFPMGLTVVFEPVAGSEDIVLHVIEDVACVFEIKNQAGPERVQGGNGGDSGLGGHRSAL